MRKLFTAESSYFDPGTMNSREAPFFWCSVLMVWLSNIKRAPTRQETLVMFGL